MTIYPHLSIVSSISSLCGFDIHMSANNVYNETHNNA